MTGLEPIAVAGGVAKAAAKAERGDPVERKALLESAQQSGALDPAARAFAKRLAVKEQVRLKIWQPIGMIVGISKGYFDNDFADDMADRLEDIPDEDLVTPRMYVAGPAVQGIALTADEPDLRDMYLNLLAAASDARRVGAVHPSFAEIIRQLSPEEAVLLKQALIRNFQPIVELRSRAATAAEPALLGYNTRATHVMDWRMDGQAVLVPERALQIVNWVRLGLVTVDYATSLTDDAHYAWVEGNPLTLELRALLDTDQFKRVEVQRGIMQVTPFGRAFHDAVVQQPTVEGLSQPGPSGGERPPTSSLD